VIIGYIHLSFALGGLARTNLLTKELADKYLDYQPMYRQVVIMKNEGGKAEMLFIS